jgi:hypothetical protein
MAHLAPLDDLVRTGAACPISGKNLPVVPSCRILDVMLDPMPDRMADPAPDSAPDVANADPALVDHLAASTGLAPAEAARVVEDVMAFYAEPVEEYVRRRHVELKARGARNPEIFARVATELRTRVVAAPQLSERQLRRLVYG